MVIFVATAFPRGDIDYVNAIVIKPHREPALRMRGVDRRSANERGGET
jgi:hypothetical protein